VRSRGDAITGTRIGGRKKRKRRNKSSTWEIKHIIAAEIKKKPRKVSYLAKLVKEGPERRHHLNAGHLISETRENVTRRDRESRKGHDTS